MSSFHKINQGFVGPAATDTRRANWGQHREARVGGADKVGFIFYLAGGQNPVVTEMTSSGDAWQSGGNTPTARGDIWKATTVPTAYAVANIGTSTYQNNIVNTWRQQPDGSTGSVENWWDWGSVQTFNCKRDKDRLQFFAFCSAGNTGWRFRIKMTDNYDSTGAIGSFATTNSNEPRRTITIDTDTSYQAATTSWDRSNIFRLSNYTGINSSELTVWNYDDVASITTPRMSYIISFSPTGVNFEIDPTTSTLDPTGSVGTGTWPALNTSTYVDAEDGNTPYDMALPETFTLQVGCSMTNRGGTAGTPQESTVQSDYAWCKYIRAV